MAKTYNSGYSLVVTHLTTNPPVRCLNRAERTGSLVFNVLWSYVEDSLPEYTYIALLVAHWPGVLVGLETLGDEKMESQCFSMAAGASYAKKLQ
jgi:hypothetical protein